MKQRGEGADREGRKRTSYPLWLLSSAVRDAGSTSFRHPICLLSLTVSNHPHSFSCSTLAPIAPSSSGGSGGCSTFLRFFAGRSLEEVLVPEG